MFDMNRFQQVRQQLGQQQAAPQQSVAGGNQNQLASGNQNQLAGGDPNAQRVPQQQPQSVTGGDPNAQRVPQQSVASGNPWAGAPQQSVAGGNQNQLAGADPNAQRVPTQQNAYSNSWAATNQNQTQLSSAGGNPNYQSGQQVQSGVHGSLYPQPGPSGLAGAYANSMSGAATRPQQSIANGQPQQSVAGTPSGQNYNASTNSQSVAGPRQPAPGGPQLKAFGT